MDSELRCCDLVLNCRNRKAARNNIDIDLTVKEYSDYWNILCLTKCGYKRNYFAEEVWDKNFDTNTNVVDVYVNYLRTKIDKDFERKLIHTVVHWRGIYHGGIKKYNENRS